VYTVTAKKFEPRIPCKLTKPVTWMRHQISLDY